MKSKIYILFVLFVFSLCKSFGYGFVILNNTSHNFSGLLTFADQTGPGVGPQLSLPPYTQSSLSGFWQCGLCTGIKLGGVGIGTTCNCDLEVIINEGDALCQALLGVFNPPPVLPCTNNITITIQNRDNTQRYYGFADASNTGASECPVKLIGLSYLPGDRYYSGMTPCGATVTLQKIGVPCGEEWRYIPVSVAFDDLQHGVYQGPSGLGMSDGYMCVNNASLIPTNSIVINKDSAAAQSSGSRTNIIKNTADQNKTTSVYDAANNNGSILYTNTTPDAAGTVNAIKQSGSALYDALNKLNNQNHSDVSGLTAALNGKNFNPTLNVSVTNSSTASGPSVSNYYNLALTNYATETTVATLTNLLSKSSTNAFEFLMSRLSALIPSSSTNGTLAESLAVSAIGESGVSGLITSLSPVFPDATPTAPDMRMSFCGYNIDLNPIHRYPNVAAASLIGWRIVLILAFFIEIGRMYWQIIQIKSSAQTGGVPDLEVVGSIQLFTFGGSIGGNFLGVLAAIAIPLVFIVLFVALMAYLFAHLGVSINEAMNVANFANSLGGIGYYFLASCFPVTLFFSLIITRITLQFAMGRLLDVAISAARFLWGR